MDVLYSQLVVVGMIAVSAILVELLELIMKSAVSCQKDPSCGHRRYSALVGKLALLEHR